ncbi:MAG: SsrA-binding protein SmpB [Bacteroidia bacterium]|nr:SsrA-binding protein SmpB [Bacteroidia bacterium]MDW8134034.1 SsrA-binding protein SmpB [Bacteroidia bacterium]
MDKAIVLNRKALSNYAILERYVAGVVLSGAEVKSLREGGGQLQDSFCVFREGELYVVNMYIPPYRRAGYVSFASRRPRKLLLRKAELNRIRGLISRKGLTIIPTKLFFSERGWAKLEIAVAQGLKKYDKRLAIREKEEMRYMERLRKRA